MKTSPDCIPCILQKVLATARAADNSEWLQRRVVFDSMNLLSQSSFDQPPAALTGDCLAKAQTMLGVQDAFVEAKKEHIRQAEAVEESVSKALAESPDPFEMAVKLAIAGNLIHLGYGPGPSLPRVLEIAKAASCAEGGLLSVQTLNALRRDVDSAKSVLYVLNNTGELYFDKILLSEIAKKCDVTAVVSASKQLNRACLADAEAAGIVSICRVLQIGGAAGARHPLQAPDFLKLYREVDLAIVKGQDGYGCLAGQIREAYFMLAVKCACYAYDLGAPMGGLVLIKR